MYSVTLMINPFDCVAESPLLFHYLRKLPELNYRTTKLKLKSSFENISGPVLDLGCGTGEFCRLFDIQNYNGLDINSRYIKYAKSRNIGYNLMSGDATKIPFADDYFRAVLIHGLLHHLSNESSKVVLREVRRVIGSQGKLVLIEDTIAGERNCLGRIMQLVDRGDFIRLPKEYKYLFDGLFNITHQCLYRSGICEYVYFELAPC